jgi:FkbM family methyltransferase
MITRIKNYFRENKNVNEITQSIPEKILSESIDLIESLQKNTNCTYVISGVDELIFTINGNQVIVTCRDDLYILNEIFSDLCYALEINEPLVVIDIGMNIGISALYFLQNQRVVNYFGFEPVESTFKMLLRNLEVNNLSNSVTLNNFGLGRENTTQIFQFSKEFKGSVGVLGLNEFKKNNSEKIENVEVKIHDSHEEIEKILKNVNGEKILLKIDCEGGEYSIIERIYETGIINRIDFIIMEWHGLEFLSLIKCFNNFNTYYYKNSPLTGMLYAQRK